MRMSLFLKIRDSVSVTTLSRSISVKLPHREVLVSPSRKNSSRMTQPRPKNTFKSRLRSTRAMHKCSETKPDSALDSVTLKRLRAT